MASPAVPCQLYYSVTAGYPPCTAQACLELLDYYVFEPTGRPPWWGAQSGHRKAAAMLLLNRNATVTLCHTPHLPIWAAECRAGTAADRRRWKGRIIVPTASPRLARQVVIDVGINVDAAGHLG